MGRAARFGACLALFGNEHPFSCGWKFGAMFGAVSLQGLVGVLASCAALVAESSDILFTCWARLGSSTLGGGCRLRWRNTVAVAWGLAGARPAGDSRAVTSAVPGTTSHELGTDITAVDVSHSAPGWALRGAGAATAGWGGRVITAAEHPLSTG